MSVSLAARGQVGTLAHLFEHIGKKLSDFRISRFYVGQKHRRDFKALLKWTINEKADCEAEAGGKTFH